MLCPAPILIPDCAVIIPTESILVTSSYVSVPPTGWAGGGPGASSPDGGSVDGTHGLQSTGGGGGGGGGPTAAGLGGNGGSGIVIVAYPT